MKGHIWEQQPLFFLFLSSQQLLNLLPGVSRVLEWVLTLVRRLLTLISAGRFGGLPSDVLFISELDGKIGDLSWKQRGLCPGPCNKGCPQFCFLVLRSGNSLLGFSCAPDAFPSHYSFFLLNIPKGEHLDILRPESKGRRVLPSFHMFTTWIFGTVTEGHYPLRMF